MDLLASTRQWRLSEHSLYLQTSFFCQEIKHFWLHSCLFFDERNCSTGAAVVNVLAAQAGPKWLLQEGAFVGFGFLGSSFMILQDSLLRRNSKQSQEDMRQYKIVWMSSDHVVLTQVDPVHLSHLSHIF